MRRRTCRVVGTLAALVCASAAVPASGGAQDLSRERQASEPKKRLAALLLRRDPGARVGGSTQVATTPAASILGVPGRTNFMMALGSDQQLVGGKKHDQLGAYRAPRGARAAVNGDGRRAVRSANRVRIHGRAGHDLIHGGHGHDQLGGGRGHDHILGYAGHDRLVGGHGHDRIHGGRGHDRLHGGHGHDRLIDRQGNTTVVPGPGRNHIDVSDGGRDRVLCHPRSQNRIVVDRGDRLHRHCRNARSTVLYRRPPVARAAQQVTGRGSNGNPYTAGCTDELTIDCDTPLFAARSLSGVWANEYVPAYKCPSLHPYLLDQGYAPAGTTLPNGVGVSGLGPIGVSITGTLRVSAPVTNLPYAAGTRTGGIASSATNWTAGTNSYQVQLHCTFTVLDGYLDFDF